MLALLAWLCTIPALVTLGIHLFNLLFWPRGKPSARFSGTISVLVPARDEEATIEACIRAIFASKHPIGEVIVCDDHSTDATPDILDRLRDEFEKLRVINGRPLPEGQVGKPHACAQLAEAARGNLLFYVDADTRLQPEAMSRVASLLQTKEADLVTAVPRQETGSMMEHLIHPLLHMIYTNWLPMPLVWLSADPRILAANGQILAVRKGAYQAIGGFEAVKHEIVDDMAFCRLAKRQGRREVFADGFHMARCRMYKHGGEVWDGFSKNLYEGIGGKPLALAALLLIFNMTYILPWLLLPLSALIEGLLIPAAVAVAANLVMRITLALHHRQNPLGILLHPVGVGILLAIAVNSFTWTRQGRLQWRGRVYAAKAQRESTEST